VRILLSCPYDWGAPGGVQVHVRELANRLSGRGHDVLVVAPGDASVEAAEKDVRTVGRPVRVPYGGKVAPIAFSRRSWQRIRETLRVFEPEVVHVHEPLSPSTSMLVARATTAPVVATFHAGHDRSRLMRAAAPILRSTYARIDARIAVSHAAADFLATAFPGPVEIVPNGVEVERFARATRVATGLPVGRRILWVSRLDPQKGFPLLVRAFAGLAREIPDLHLVVVGDGRDRNAVDLLAPDVRARVAMLGAIANAELPAYLAGADVFAAPAVGHESFGVILVEAMAAGVPVVASDIPGYREVVREDVDGLLVPPGNADLLAERIRQVLEDPDLSKRLAAAGPDRARTFSWDVVVPRIEAIYERVAGRSGTSG
jgi:phosphatidylinositol alpha-mannosyltransferase